MPSRDEPSEPTRWGWRGRLAIGGLLALVLAAAWTAGRLGAAGIAGGPALLVAAVYAIALSVPFVPGAEIGLAILAMGGAAAAPLVWGATVAGLTMAYLVGRRVPPRAVAAGLGRLGLRRASRLVLTLEPMDADARLAHLVSAAPTRVVPLLLRHRHLALAVALNLPGNALLGGGGGLALAAGLSRLYAPGPFVATVALAAAPVPLAVALAG